MNLLKNLVISALVFITCFVSMPGCAQVIDANGFSNGGLFPVGATALGHVSSGTSTTQFTISDATAPANNSWIAFNSGPTTGNYILGTGATTATYTGATFTQTGGITKITAVSGSTGAWVITVSPALPNTPASGDIFYGAPSIFNSNVSSGNPYYYYSGTNNSIDTTGLFANVGTGIYSLKTTANVKMGWTYNNTDGSVGNDTVSCKFYFNSGPTSFGLVIRDPVTSSSPAQNGYYLTTKNALFQVAKIVNGTVTGLSSSLSPTISNSHRYYEELSVTGTAAPITLNAYFADLEATNLSVVAGTLTTSSFTATLSSGTAPTVGQTIYGATGTNTGSSSITTITSVSGPVGGVYTIGIAPSLGSSPIVGDTFKGKLWLNSTGSYSTSSVPNVTKIAAITYTDNTGVYVNAGRAGFFVNNTASSTAFVTDLTFTELNPLLPGGWQPGVFTSGSAVINWNSAIGGVPFSGNNYHYSLRSDTNGSHTFATAANVLATNTTATTYTDSSSAYTSSTPSAPLYYFLEAVDQNGIPIDYTYITPTNNNNTALPVCVEPTSSGSLTSTFYSPFIMGAPLTQDTSFLTGTVADWQRYPSERAWQTQSTFQVIGNPNAASTNGEWGSGGLFNTGTVNVGTSPAFVTSTGTQLIWDSIYGTGNSGFTLNTGGTSYNLMVDGSNLFPPDQFTMDIPLKMLSDQATASLGGYSDGGNEQMTLQMTGTTITATFNTSIMSYNAPAATVLTLTNTNLPLGTSTSAKYPDAVVSLVITGASGGTGNATLYLWTAGGYLSASQTGVPIPILTTGDPKIPTLRFLANSSVGNVSVGRIRIAGHGFTPWSNNGCTPGVITINPSVAHTTPYVLSPGAPVNPDLGSGFGEMIGLNTIFKINKYGNYGMQRISALPENSYMQDNTSSTTGLLQGTFATNFFNNWVVTDRTAKYYNTIAKRYNLSMDNVPNIFGGTVTNYTVGTGSSSTTSFVLTTNPGTNSILYVTSTGGSTTANTGLNTTVQTVSGSAPNFTVTVLPALNITPASGDVFTTYQHSGGYKLTDQTGTPYSDLEMKISGGAGGLYILNTGIFTYTDYANWLSDLIVRFNPANGALIDFINEPTSASQAVTVYNGLIGRMRSNLASKNYKYFMPTPAGSFTAALSPLFVLLVGTGGNGNPVDGLNYHDYTGNPTVPWRQRGLLGYLSSLTGAPFNSPSGGATLSVLTGSSNSAFTSSTNPSVGQVLQCTSGADAGQIVSVLSTSGNSSPFTINVVPNLSVAPGSGDVFMLETYAGPEITVTSATDSSHFTTSTSVPVGQVLVGDTGHNVNFITHVTAISSGPPYTVTVSPAFTTQPVFNDTIQTGYGSRYLTLIPLMCNEGGADVDVMGSLYPWKAHPQNNTAWMGANQFYQMTTYKDVNTLFRVIARMDGHANAGGTFNNLFQFGMDSRMTPNWWASALWQNYANATAGQNEISATAAGTPITCTSSIDSTGNVMWVLLGSDTFFISPTRKVTLSIPSSWHGATVTRTVMNQFLGSYNESGGSDLLTNQVYTLTLDGNSGHSITMTFGGSGGTAATTGSIAGNASASTIQTALTGLATIGSGNATVTGSGPFTITVLKSAVNPYADLTATGTALTSLTSVYTGNTAPPQVDSSGNVAFSMASDEICLLKIDKGNIISGGNLGITYVPSPTWTPNLSGLSTTIYKGVILNWAATTDPNFYEYRIYRNNRLIWWGPALTYTDLGDEKELLDVVAYSYEVRAVDIYGNETAAGSFTASITPSNTTNGTGPNAVTNMNAYGGVTAIEASWTPPTNTDLWFYVIDFTAGSTAKNEYMAGATYCHFTVAVATASYTLRITPYNTSGIAGTPATITVNSADNTNLQHWTVSNIGGTSTNWNADYNLPGGTLLSGSAFTTSGGTLSWTAFGGNNGNGTYYAGIDHLALYRQRTDLPNQPKILISGYIKPGSPTANIYSGTITDPGPLTSGATYTYYLYAFSNGINGSPNGNQTLIASLGVTVKARRTPGHPNIGSRSGNGVGMIDYKMFEKLLYRDMFLSPLNN